MQTDGHTNYISNRIAHIATITFP